MKTILGVSAKCFILSTCVWRFGEIVIFESKSQSGCISKRRFHVSVCTYYPSFFRNGDGGAPSLFFSVFIPQAPFTKMQSCSAAPPTGLEYSLLRCQWCPVLSQQMFFRIVHKNLPHSSPCVQDLNLSIEQPLCEGHKTLETRGKGYKRFIFTQQYCVLNISFEDGKRLTELYLDMTTKPKLRG